MTGELVRALDLYPGWETYQELLIKAVAPLTDEQLHWRTANNLRSVGETCRHIIGARARWCVYTLGLGDAATKDLGEWDGEGLPERPAAELIEGLRASWAVLRDALRGWTIADLAITVPNRHPDPGEPDEFSRVWVLWHLVEHDIHHSGEITEILGAHGAPGVAV